MSQLKRLIGAGWSVPVQVNQRGGVALVDGEEEISQAIEIVLSTPVGTRVMRPTFGSRVHELTFAPLNATTFGDAERFVREALQMWEPRIEVDEVLVSADPQIDGCLLIEVGYTIKATLDKRTLVFPFYSIPGEG